MKDTVIQQALASCRSAFVIVTAFSFGVNALALASPLYMLQLYNRVLPSRSTDTLILLALIVVAALAVLSALEGLRRQMLSGMADWLQDRTGPAVLENGLRQALHGNVLSGQGLQDLATLRGFLGGGGVIPLLDAPWTPIFLLALFVLNPLLGMIGVAGAVILFGLALLNEMATRGALQRAAAAEMAAAQRTGASLRNAEVVRALGMEDGVIRRWRLDGRTAQEALERAGRRQTIIFALSRFARTGIQAIIMGAAAWLAIHQNATAGTIFASSFLLSRALAPVENAIGTWKSLVTARAAYRRLREGLTRFPARRGAIALPEPVGDLEVEQLSFVPPGSTRLTLRNVSFRLSAGQVLVIVGPSGAGKSTLARLIAGAWAPGAGAVRMDGADIASWLDSGGSGYLGYLPQDIELFTGTVRDNIARLRRPEETDPRELIRVAKLAGLHETILRLPQGYDTEIGDGGVRLSGGQRQRLGLARAMYGGPKLVVLDEPNSSLDTAGEEALLDAIRQMREDGTTVIVVTHRPSILGIADRIMALRDGVMEVYGQRNELIARLNSAQAATSATTPAAAQNAAVQRRQS